MYCCLGDAYSALGRYNLAQQAFAKAVRIDPDDERARRKLKEWNECRNGVTDKAIGMIARAFEKEQAATTTLLAARFLAENPDNDSIEVIDNYGEMLYQMMRYDEAIRVYLEAIERFPDSRWQLFNQMGNLHYHRGDFPTAELWY